MKLYYAPNTRAFRPRWMLEEVGVPYEIVKLDLARGDHKKPDYLRIHPLGKVPALQDGPLTLMESGAICLYLGDKYPEKKLAPALGSPERGLYYQWVLFATTMLDGAVLGKNLPEAQRMLAVLEKQVESTPYLAGESFTAADVLCGSILNIAVAYRMLEGGSRLGDYLKRIKARPAYQRARTEPK
ncbi:glutathione S-transferase family protein [bacterium]|nr:glutathione S-transferase family protein [bacterium]